MKGVTENERWRKEWRYLSSTISTEILEVIWDNISEEMQGIILHNNLGNITWLHSTLVALFSTHPCTKSQLLDENLTCFWHQHGSFSTHHLLTTQTFHHQVLLMESPTHPLTPRLPTRAWDYILWIR